MDKEKLPTFRFSLRTLLIVMTLACVAIYWYTQYCKADSAKREFEFAAAAFESGNQTRRQFCDASLKWCEAECRVPFASDRLAWTSHLARILNHALRCQLSDELGLQGADGPEGLEEIHKFRKQAEAWLAADQGK